ncbi:MAG: hypothetical protein FWE46_00480 [Coriobacteriia bacterium]|nr:hypothetical protein [Coriobacteriia bacterium]MCL2536751.1 hypothetical protein [Coriobacteriia bacterium]
MKNLIDISVGLASSVAGKLAQLPAAFVRRAQSDSGQGVSEYIIILAVIVIACIILAVAFHGQLESLWSSVTGKLGAIPQ